MTSESFIIHYFSNIIVSNGESNNFFICFTTKMDETRRASMWKLRQTWNDVFPSQKLLQLDLRVQSIDPAWPVTASSSIHVNPKFLSIVSFSYYLIQKKKNSLLSN